MASDGAGRGHLVGVDVVVLAIKAERHRAEDGHAVRLPYGFDQARIAGSNFAHKAEVGRGAFFARAEAQPVSAGESYGRLTDRSQRGDQSFIHLAGKDHQRHVARLGVGDAQTIDELALLAQRFERARQLHAAAVNHGHLMAIAHKIGNSARAAFQQRRSLQACSTQFNDVLHSRPSDSPQPSITFRFCTAWPEAPFSKLSRQLTITARRPPASIWKPMSA